MYPEYEQVNAFFQDASRLLESSRTMEAIFHLTMQRNEKNIAVEYLDEKKKIKNYKYSQMRSNSYAIAGVLNNLLMQKPKHRPIILKLANSPHWGEVFWAILMAGYKPLLVDAKVSKEGTENLANQSNAIAIISDDIFSYSITKYSLEELLSEKKHFSFAPTWENEIIFCSSGTTGDVKLMVYNGENMCHQICCSLDMPKETKDIMYPKKLGDIKILAMIPFHHIFGFVAVFLWYTFYGKTLVFPSSNAPSEIQALCQKTGVSHIYSVPLFWDSLALTIERRIALMGEKEQQKLDMLIGYNTGKITLRESHQAGHGMKTDDIQKMLLGKDVRFCISGGGYLSNQTLTIINGLGYPLYNGYGMTELGVTSVELSSNVLIRLKGRIGKPFHGVEYKILSNGKNKNLGELLVRSKCTHVREIIGGVEQPATLDEEGYFHTGDIAEVDATGGYFIRGRIKDIIINSDGENVFPDELEIFFKELPHVTHLCVLGVSLKKSQNEDIVLVLETDNSITKAEIQTIKEKIKEISVNLPHKVTISDVFLAKNKLPLANNMKVKRYVIKKALESKSTDYVSINNKKVAKNFDGFDKETIEKILIPVRNCFSEVLYLPEFKIEDEAHWINDLGGDSMSYVEVVQKIQEFFGIQFPEEKLGQMSCINEFVEEIANLLKDANK